MSLPQHSDPVGARGEGSHGLLHSLETSIATIDHVLPLLGVIAAAFTREDFATAVDATLDALREAFDADDAEIFLSEPEGTDLLLAACRGADADELLEQTRFAVGLGYPGRVVEQGAPLVSRDLASDPTYLRRGVVQRGVSAYACVPIHAPCGFQGSLQVAWHHPPETLDAHTQALQQVASLVSTYITARMSQLRRAVDQTMEAVRDQGPAGRLLALLRLVHQETGWSHSLARLFAGSTDEVLVSYDSGVHTERGLSPSRCCPCDVIREGHGDYLDGAHRACNASPMLSGMQAPCRIPLNYAGQSLGCVVVDVGFVDAAPATAHLLPLLVIAQQAARHLRVVRGRAVTPTPAPAPRVPTRGLRIFGFGSFRVMREDAELSASDFPRRAAVDLLRMLLLQPNRTRPAEQVIELLWPDTDPAAGRNRLQVTLHALRQLIEPKSKRGRWRYIQLNKGQCSLDTSEDLWTDFDAFEEAWARVAKARRAGSSPELWIDDLEFLLGLYVGDLYADVPYAPWCEFQRTRLQRTCIEATLLHAEVCLEQGRFDTAIERLLRGLALDDLDETMNYRLVEFLLATGDRERAERHYAAYVRKLHRELGCAPPPKMQALHELVQLARRDFDAARAKLRLPSHGVKRP